MEEDTPKATSNDKSEKGLEVAPVDDRLVVEELSTKFLLTYQSSWKGLEAKGQERDYFEAAAASYVNQIWRSYNTIRVFGMQ